MRTIVILLTLLAFQGRAQQPVSQQLSDDYFAQSLRYREHKNYPAAANGFQQFMVQVAAADTRYALANFYQAECALLAGRADGPLLMDQFMDAYPDHPMAEQGYFTLAMFHYRSKNFEQAVSRFGKIRFSALSDEDQLDGRFAWGYSLFNLRQLPKALEQFNYVKATAGAYGPASSYYAGYIEYGAGEDELALSDFKRAEGSASYATVVPVLIAGVYNRQGRDSELLSYVDGALKREQVAHRDELNLLAAEAQFRKKNYSESLKGYQEYLEGRTNPDRGVLFRAGLSAFAQSQFALAKGLFGRAASEADSLGQSASYYLGASSLQTGDRQSALTSFQVARRSTDPAIQEESSYQIAKVLYDLGRADQAVDELELYLKAFPTSVHDNEMSELLSAAYVNASNYNKAITHVEAMTRRTPIMNSVYQKATYFKGTELFNKDDWSQAITMFDKSMTVPTDKAIAAACLFWRGEAQSALRQYDPAIGSYQQAVNMELKDPELMASLRYGLGYAFFNLQQFDKALFHFRELSKYPTDGSIQQDGLLRLGDCYYVAKSYTEAVAAYKRAIQLRASESDYAYLQAGVIEGILRQYDAAAGDLDRVIRDFPQSKYWDEAVYQRGQLDFGRGNYASAASAFSRLLGSGKPGTRFTPLAHLRRAASYFNLKDYNRTADDYIRVLTDYPAVAADQDVLLPLQEALNLAGRSQEFDGYLAKFKTANPNAKGVESVEFESARNYYFNQDYPRSETGFANYVAGYPESARITEARYYLAETRYRRKDYERALQGFTEIATATNFEYYNKVIGRKAELESRLNKPELAIQSYQTLAAIATTKKEQFTGWTGLMENYYLLAQYDSSSGYAHKLSEAATGAAQNRAGLYLGKNALARGDYETAKDEFVATVNIASDEFGAEAKYRLAEIFYLTKEHKPCYETLISLNKDYQAYPEWVGRSFLLLADNYAATGDVFQAKATLRSLDKFPLDMIKQEAASKLKSLEEQELKLRKTQPTDTTDQQ
ncbi:MAG: tetratricopeptide repeat protein [Cyclobacteriaceae bacterium]|nr:tetratricopeptide repeat protein [Cyclobacteriaceae bacterium]